VLQSPIPGLLPSDIPSEDQRELTLRATMQSLEPRKVETIAIAHRMVLDALKSLQYALELADADVPMEEDSLLVDKIMVTIKAKEVLSEGWASNAAMIALTSSVIRSGEFANRSSELFSAWL
jgi:hypothetical protein